MVMIHGFSDHVNRYYGFFPYLAERGIAVYGYDQRGWGRSVKKPGDRGKTGPTSRVLADMAAFIRAKLEEAPRDAPIFVLGHSMGGGQTLTLVSTPEYEDLVGRVRGWMLESPFVGFAPELQPHWLTVASGRLAAHVVPNFKMVRPIPPEHLTRDPEVQRSLADDPLLHDTGTLEGLAGMLDRTDKLRSGALKPSKKVKSLFVVHGTEDKSTSCARSKEWFDRHTFEDGTFKAYDGVYHQIHADLGKEEFYKDVADWILQRVDTPGDVAPKL